MIASFILACDDGDGGGSTTTDSGVTADMMAGGAGGMADAEVMPDAEVAPGTLSLDTASLDFGEVGVNMSARLEVVISHTGGGPASVTAFEGLDAPFFIGRQPPINVPEGASRTIEVEFRPDSDQLVERTLQFVTDNPDATPLTLEVKGVGVQASAELVSDTLDFGVLSPGQSASATLQVRNSSETAVLSINSIDGVEAPFSGTENFQPRQVEPGLTEDIPLLFSSDAGGMFEGIATVRTSAGDFVVTLRARVIDPGSLQLDDVEPAWAPVDVATTVTVYGGPFEVLPDAVRLGERVLTDLTLVDAERIQGTLMAGPDAAGDLTDVLDVRVEIGELFGVLAGGFVQTPPVAEGQTLDADALAGAIGPEGNPWRLAVDEIPAGQTVTLSPGTVILGEGRTLTVSGELIADGAEGRIVFSAAEATPGAWEGLVFPASDAGDVSTLSAVTFEYTGDAAVLIRRPQVSLNTLVVRQGSGDGVRVEDGGQLLLQGARMTDLGGDAVDVIAAGGEVLRLRALYSRRCEWPVASYVGHFGGRPQGAGSDWAESRAGDAIGLGGTLIADGSLSNQPAGVPYQVRSPIQIARGATLTLASAAPLLLDGPISVEGTLELPQGLNLQASTGGLIDVLGGGTLVANGGNGAEVAIRGRAPEAEEAASSWHGIRVGAGGTIQGRFVILQDAGVPVEEGEAGAALSLAGTFEDLVAFQIRDAVGAAASISSSGSLRAFQMSGNAEGIKISGGEGLLAGEIDGNDPAVEFAEQALCGLWNLEGVLTPMGLAASTNCMGE
ncbi:MAG: choice-of-anchor D domain-containing protein [Bradymonadia bacterium]